MPREFSRHERVGAQMKRELALLIRDQLGDPRLGMVSVQEVRVTRDLAHAKVYVTALAARVEPHELVRLLQEHAGQFRHLLGRVMRLRTLPELKFVYDESIEEGARMDALINRAVRSDAHEEQ